MADNNDNKITVKFAPGVIEQMEAEMSPEELQEFMDAIAKLTETGQMNEVFDRGEPVDMEKIRKEDPELFETLSNQLEGCFDENGNPPTVH